jgi:twitching motility protein PilT
MVDEINVSRPGHIVTLEDPIEFVHSYKKCVVTQREIGMHARTFAGALRDALREDPDVVLVGELRDPETIALALTAAETGIQILATLHTSGASRSIDRIVNAFPPRRRDQVQAMLADSLRMVVSQQLVATVEGNSRVPVVEILVNTAAVAAMIRAGQSQKLENAIQTGASSGMQGLDATLKALVRTGKITAEEACAHALDRIQFEPGVTAAAAGIRPAA